MYEIEPLYQVIVLGVVGMLGPIVTAIGAYMLGVKLASMTAAQAEMTFQQGRMREEQKALAVNMDGKITKLLEVNKIASHAAGVIEGSAIKTDIVDAVKEATTAAIATATNGNH